jgi:hypothetical protein
VSEKDPGRPCPFVIGKGLKVLQKYAQIRGA